MLPSVLRGHGLAGFAASDTQRTCAGVWRLMPLRQVVIQPGVSRS